MNRSQVYNLIDHNHNVDFLVMGKSNAVAKISAEIAGILNIPRELKQLSKHIGSLGDAWFVSSIPNAKKNIVIEFDNNEDDPVTIVLTLEQPNKKAQVQSPIVAEMEKNITVCVKQIQKDLEEAIATASQKGKAIAFFSNADNIQRVVNKAYKNWVQGFRMLPGNLDDKGKPGKILIDPNNLYSLKEDIVDSLPSVDWIINYVSADEMPNLTGKGEAFKLLLEDEDD